MTYLVKGAASTGEGAGGFMVERSTAHEPLRECVKDALERYLENLQGHPTGDLYELVMTEVEGPLLETVLRHAKGNQSRAAELLGINRGTLRKKLKRYDLM
ncbi:MAG: DNA-binding transcriptional regulator Fis [Gammaproteobacteria bacterium]|nr:DNA-binding transcriptional regulator Fis [Gammaproteobacteria bacterium]